MTLINAEKANEIATRKESKARFDILNSLDLSIREASEQGLFFIPLPKEFQVTDCDDNFTFHPRYTWLKDELEFAGYRVYSVSSTLEISWIVPNKKI